MSKYLVGAPAYEQLKRVSFLSNFPTAAIPLLIKIISNSCCGISSVLFHLKSFKLLSNKLSCQNVKLSKKVPEFAASFFMFVLLFIYSDKNIFYLLIHNIKIGKGSYVSLPDLFLSFYASAM